MLEGELKALVDEKAQVIESWMEHGKIARTDPYHLIFSIWATTQHYADFDVQVRAVLGKDRGGEGRFEDAARYLEHLFMDGLRPKANPDGSAGARWRSVAAALLSTRSSWCSTSVSAARSSLARRSSAMFASTAAVAELRAVNSLKSRDDRTSRLQ